MIGSLEKKKNGYLMRVTIGYNQNGNPDRLSKMSYAETEKQANIDLARWVTELEQKGYEKPQKMSFIKFYRDYWLSYSEKNSLKVPGKCILLIYKIVLSPPSN